MAETKNEIFQVNGLSASSVVYFIAKHFGEGLIITPGNRDLESIRESLEYFLQSKTPVLSLPAFERVFEPVRQEPKTTYDRIRTQVELSRLRVPYFLVTSLEALSQMTLSPQELQSHCVSLKKGEMYDREVLVSRLFELGYRQDDLAEDAGFFSVRGHLVDIFSPYEKLPYRLEFFGDEILSIRTFDSETQRSLTELIEIEILPCRELVIRQTEWPKIRNKIRNESDGRGFDREDRDRILDDLENHRELLEPRWLLPAVSNLVPIESYLSEKLPIIFLDEDECKKRFEEYIKDEDASAISLKRLAYGPIHSRSDIQTWHEKPHSQLETRLSAKGLSYQVMGLEDLRSRIQKTRSFREVVEQIRVFREQGYEIDLVFANLRRKSALLESAEVPSYVNISQGPLFDGFASSTFHRAIINEKDIFGSKKKKAKTAEQTSEEFLRQFSDLKDGDYVIHEDHGLAQFRGLQVLDLHQAKSEFLVLEYADRDKLYLPIYRVDKISRYVSEGYAQPKLDKLGSQVFSKKKARIKKDILRIAHELLEVAAARRLNRVERAPLASRDSYHEFGQMFQYEPTADQEGAIIAVEKDLTEPWPMDRLVCGDVGFGKTEVALRAAMFSALQGKQVALLAPTTILVEQHYRTFNKRFDPFPFRVVHLSRFVSTKEQKRILDEIEKGAAQIIIGTHRLLQSDVRFKDLGLLIVDEEQRFGVKHKEKIKKLKATTDVLTLSATPIPRTLQMSILGIRELSLIATPPESREAVKTFIGAFDEDLIRRACLKERERNGQIFFVHNRIQSIHTLESRLKKLLPDFKIVVAHGQMHEDELEKRIMTFIDQKADILLATAIIEHGLDIPNANTIFIDHPEMFGLSDLYQLRGRVGRSHLSASAYFLIHENTPLTPEASKRLQVIQSCTDLGSGFHVATHDMEIRGSGNILGEEQSGVIAEVGLELYTEMLQEALAELKSEERSEPLPELNSGYTSYIPETYIPDASVRIATYKRLDKIKTPGHLLDFENELLDRFGIYPREVENLCQLSRLRVLAHALKAGSLEVFPGRLSLHLLDSTPLEPKKLMPKLGKNLGIDQKGRLTFSFESALKKDFSVDPKYQAHREMHDFKLCHDLLLSLCDLAEVSIQAIAV